MVNMPVTHKETDWLTKLAMEESGQKAAIIPSLNQDYEARLNDGLYAMLSLMQHVLDKKSIVTQDVLLNIIHARTVDLISLRKMYNATTEIP
jgi:hypothetical protein